MNGTVRVVREVESSMALLIDGQQVDIVRYGALGFEASGGKPHLVRVFTKFSQHEIPFDGVPAKFRTNGHTYEWRELEK